MRSRMLIAAGALLALEAASAAWAWPRIERWTETPSFRVWVRVGERAAARATDRARDLVVRVAERTSGDALERMARALAPMGRPAPAAAEPAVARLEARRAPCATVRAAAELERIRLRRVVSPEAIF